jgi:hypothetical protein
MTSDRIIICRSSSDAVVAFAESLAVALWRYHTSAEDVRELEAAARRAHEAGAGPVGLIQIVPSTAVSPDSYVRKELARMLRDLNGIVSHSAIVHEAVGFRAAMVRSIVTGVAALSNPGFPHRVFTKLPEAAAWMANDDPRLSPFLIASTVAKVRAVVAPTPGARQPSSRRMTGRSV